MADDAIETIVAGTAGRTVCDLDSKRSSEADRSTLCARDYQYN